VSKPTPSSNRGAKLKKWEEEQVVAQEEIHFVGGGGKRGERVHFSKAAQIFCQRLRVFVASEPGRGSKGESAAENTSGGDLRPRTKIVSPDNLRRKNRCPYRGEARGKSKRDPSGRPSLPRGEGRKILQKSETIRWVSQSTQSEKHRAEKELEEKKGQGAQPVT